MGNTLNATQKCIDCTDRNTLSSEKPCDSCIVNGGELDNFTPLGIVAPKVEGNVVNDAVNHPQHYCTGKYECIDVMLEVFGTEVIKDFCICNAFKYIYRHNKKNNLEDVKKAQYYINKYIELSESRVSQ